MNNFLDQFKALFIEEQKQDKHGASEFLYPGHLYNPNNKNLLLVDDDTLMIRIAYEEIKNLKNKLNRIPYVKIENYNVFQLTGRNIDTDFERFMKLDIHIDYALIDLYYGLANNVDFDGIDIASKLMEKQKGRLFFKFLTGSRLDLRMGKDSISYADKFKKLFNRDITDFIIFKQNSNTKTALEQLYEVFYKFN